MSVVPSQQPRRPRRHCRRHRIVSESSLVAAVIVVVLAVLVAKGRCHSGDGENDVDVDADLGSVVLSTMMVVDVDVDVAVAVDADPAVAALHSNRDDSSLPKDSYEEWATTRLKIL